MADQKITFWKKLLVFTKNNGRIIIGGTLIFIVLMMGIMAPLLTEFDPSTTNGYKTMLAAGEEGHLLGTDYLGRDIWARILYGARTSIILAVAVQIVTIAVGCILGLICGYYPKVDLFLMRALEAINALPTILLVYVLVMIMGNGYTSLVFAMVVGSMTGIARYIRAQVMSLRQKEFVERELVIGAGTIRTMILHVLPHCSSYLLVRFGSGLGANIMSLATLSFLGVGLPGGAPSWGADIAKAQSSLLAYPDKVFYPMIAIAITVYGFSMLADGLRDYMSPELRH